MIRALFAPQTPYEAEKAEREAVARKKPHVALVSSQDPRPDPDMFRWWSVAELMERGR